MERCNDGNPIDAKFKAIVTPNATTAYAVRDFWIYNLNRVVMEMPEVTDRYFALQIMNPYGIFDLYAEISSTEQKHAPIS